MKVSRQASEPHKAELMTDTHHALHLYHDQEGASHHVLIVSWQNQLGKLCLTDSILTCMEDKQHNAGHLSKVLKPHDMKFPQEKWSQ